MSTSPLFSLRPLFICLTSQLYLWEYIWSSQQILISLFGFLQIKAHSSKFNLVFRSHSVLESLRKFGLALNLWKWQCSEGVVWFGFNELFLSLFPDNSWCPYRQIHTDPLYFVLCKAHLPFMCKESPWAAPGDILCLTLVISICFLLLDLVSMFSFHYNAMSVERMKRRQSEEGICLSYCLRGMRNVSLLVTAVVLPPVLSVCKVP